MKHLTDSDIVWSSLQFSVESRGVTIFAETTVPGAEEIGLRLYSRHPAFFRLVAGLPNRSKFVRNFLRKCLEEAINASTD